MNKASGSVATSWLISHSSISWGASFQPSATSTHTRTHANEEERRTNTTRRTGRKRRVENKHTGNSSDTPSLAGAPVERVRGIVWPLPVDKVLVVFWLQGKDRLTARHWLALSLF